MSELHDIQLISHLINLSSDAIVVVEPLTGGIVFVNEQMCTNLGYSRDELYGMRFIDFDTVVSDSSSWEKAMALVKEKGSLMLQSEHRRKDGTVFPVEISIKYSEVDNKSYIIAIARNITDHRLYEEAILASEKRFRNLSENLSELVYQADPDTFASVYVNKAHERLFGYRIEEWLKNPNLWADSIYAEDKERVLTALKDARRKLKDGIIEYRVKTKKNEIRWVEDHYSWHVDKQGKPESINGVVYDITGRKRADKELKTRLRQQASIAELSQCGLSGTDIQVLMNDAVTRIAEGLEVEFCKILKLLPDGKSLLLLAGVGWKEGLVGSATVPAGSDSQAGYTLSINEPVIVTDLRAETRFNGPPLLHEHGVVSGMSIVIAGKERPFGVLGVHTDKQRIFTRDDINFLRSAANVIGAAIQRRETEEHLSKMHKLESLGVLAGGIAHDFNNLMTGVLGYITLAKMTAGSKRKVIENLDNAEKACLRTKELTRQLITFSKGGTPVKRNISISELIKESVTFTLSGSNAKPVFNIPDDLWPTEVDEGQISQVINNLILNADQAMPEGGIISVSCENVVIGEGNEATSHRGRYVKITVSDQGCGIAAEHIDKIFDPFFTTKKIGNGLGLSTVYSIIKRHDGYIKVESESGKGTTFYIYLPASENEVFEREEEENLIYGNGRILLVDDEEAVRDVGQMMLERLGYEVKTAEDGLKAIELYKHAKDSGKPIDVVILDLTIRGGMGGKETLRNLRVIDPDIKAIVSSGYSSAPLISKYKEFGFKGYLSKPYKLVEIGKAVSRVIKNDLLPADQ